MVTQLKLAGFVGLVAVGAALLGGCGEPKGQDLSKTPEQPPANLEAGKSAQTLEQWSAANPNNGAPGSGESEGK